MKNDGEFTAKELYENKYTVVELKGAKYEDKEVYDCGCMPSDMYKANYTCNM